MYCVTNRVYVAPDHRHQFEERFRQQAGEIERNPGFVRMEIMRPHGEDTPYLVQTVWESKAAFEQWVDSDHFREAHANPLPDEAFSAPSAMERHEVVIFR